VRAFDQEQLKRCFDRHKVEPEVSVDAYLRRLRINLGKLLDGKISIYLDKRFWILIRDVAIGRNSGDHSARLLEGLRALVGSGCGFCPISESLFMELLKQEDLATRRATAALIDELSLGVTLSLLDERVGTELAHFLYSHESLDSVYPLRWLVWNKLCYVLGAVHPTSTAFEPYEERLIQKAFVDHLWQVPLVEIIGTLGECPELSSHIFHDLAQRLTKDSQLYSDEIRSFKQAYTAEAAGAVSLFTGVAADILQDM